ncbi:MAG: Uma2 family endonuclease [Gemmataceae bacterium]|nr:Uma2 family endonuclease [Gemmataceae bacterium]
MATAALPLPPPPVLPGPPRWTVDLFHRVKGSGVWEGRKILLIDGELVEMPAPKPPHDIALSLADYLFKALFGPGHVVRIQMGLVLNINTDPIPDLAVVPGDPRSMVATPATAVLVLEVSDTTFAFDANEKAGLYAAAGIADYWVVDVTGRRVLVYRSPAPDPKGKYGAGYSSVTVLSPGQGLAPLAAPHAPVAADDLLP